MSIAIVETINANFNANVETEQPVGLLYGYKYPDIFLDV